MRSKSNVFVKLWLIALCVVSLMSLLPISGYALEVKELYEIEIPVTSRNSTDRNQAFQQALMVALIRITGNREVFQHPGVGDILQRASQYVQQYRYLGAEEDPTNLLLWVRFDRNVLESALVRAGLPVWGKERPLVLVWIAIQDQAQRYLVSEDKNAQIIQAMQKTAKDRGVPMIFPLLDLQDQNLISDADVIGGFDDRVIEASKRYQSDAILVATSTRLSDGFWRARWRLYFRDQSKEWLSQGGEIDGVLVEGVHDMATVLSNQLAVIRSETKETGVILQILGVTTLQDYARVVNYLASLDQIEIHRPYRIESNKISFWIKLRGDPPDLERLISLGELLVKVEKADLVSSSNVKEMAVSAPLILNYQLQQ